MILVASLLFGYLSVGVPRTPVVRTEAVARELVMNFNAGRFTAATKDLSPELANLVTPEILAQEKKKIAAQFGIFLSVREARNLRAEDGRKMVDLVTRYERGYVGFRFVFDEKERIATVFIDPIATVDPKLEEAVRTFVAHFRNRRFDEAVQMFDPAMHVQLTAARLAQLSATVDRTFGPWTSDGTMRQESDDKMRAVTLSATHAKAPVEVRVVFKDDGTISGLRIAPPAKQ